MSNTLTNLQPKILARGLLALREQVVMVRAVNTDMDDLAAQKGATIDVPFLGERTATDVTPAAVPPTPSDVTVQHVQVTLDQWKKDNFHLTDKEAMEIDADESYIPMNMTESIRALAFAINADIWSKYKGVYGYTGTAGTTPFASTVDGATQLRKILAGQKAPLAPRSGVVDFDAEANMLALAQFSDAEKTGSPDAKILGDIGQKYGFDWIADNQVVTHTAGTLLGDPTVTGAEALLETTIGLTTDANDQIALLEGDIVVFSNHTQTYAVGADLTVGYSSSGDLTISPGLTTALSGGETIAVKGDHVVNLGFHRDAFAFASRPLVQSAADRNLGNVMEMTDPLTGLSLRLEVMREYKQTVWEFDVLYGSNLVRGALAARLAG